jgi:malonyl CoA-acyl carrier protein transacylase
VKETLRELNKDRDIEVSVSIYLGGFLVLAGNERGLTALHSALPAIKLGSNHYPFRLAMHSAFHSALLRELSISALDHFSKQPLNWLRMKYPLIDGRGYTWLPHGAARPDQLLKYTLAQQVSESFDFSAAIRTGLREYNPDQVVLLGPGSTLGSIIAQVMIAEGWRGLSSRDQFIEAQNGVNRPLVALGRDDQRAELFSQLSTGV